VNRRTDGMSIRGGQPRFHSFEDARAFAHTLPVSALPTYRLILRVRIIAIGGGGVIGLARVKRGTPGQSDTSFARLRTRDISRVTWVSPAGPNGDSIALALSGLSTFLRTRIAPIVPNGRVGAIG
jgi:hypothetical protein